MSLITRCPACETMFKVVPDQLRISEGWVRCGQCDEVFDASLHLVPAVPEIVGSATDYQDETPSDVTESLQPELQPVDIPLDMDQVDGVDEQPAEDALIGPRASDEGIAESSPDLMVQESELEAAEDERDPEPQDSIPASEVSFLRDNHADAVPRRPLVRAGWALLIGLLLLGLVGQLVIHERDRIAASEPALRPWLMALCEPLHCTLSPLRRIESIVIESSSFTRIRGTAYRLNLTVKNTASMALAVPAIELTLTDSRDQPLVRRVFSPVELGAKSDTLAMGTEWSMSMAMAVSAAGAADRVAGYRLLAFYP
ncbi:DUF3426 domain-containing protein [Rhodoferax sp.]|uniref:DUF3426 domain-containing protein n=1 Tax=Rhodoferax sp. TaxID=50421 RepID=UPI001EBF9512|nr:DUF3426 domain-containing protein [Rhodoferax sp.]MBT9505357.1 DUF3426 domain-containing protein [Rhodoferax sp.]